MSTLKIEPKDRDLLLKYFQSQPPDKPLTPEEFNQVKGFLDSKRGGLKKEAYETIKDDKELVKAAAISQAHRDQRLMDNKAPEIRDVLLKALRSKPNEKTLSLDEFKDVVLFLDRKNGGLRQHAFKIFKDDKEITEAAKTHREAWRANAAEVGKQTESKGEKALGQVKSETTQKLTKLQERIRKRTQGMEVEESQELEPGA